MPKIAIVMEFSWKFLAIRLVSGFAAAFSAFIALYFIPANLASFVFAGGFSGGFASSIHTLIASLMSPALLNIGLLITVLVFVGAVVRGSRIYGLVLVLTGLSFIAYVYTLFQGGSVSVQIPRGLVENVSGSIAVQLNQMMFLLILPSLLTIVKGAILLVPERKQL